MAIDVGGETLQALTEGRCHPWLQSACPECGSTWNQRGAIRSTETLGRPVLLATVQGTSPGADADPVQKTSSRDATTATESVDNARRGTASLPSDLVEWQPKLDK
ncbi:hypothetical protein ACFCYH_08420 [Streptomyces sp. NPDC056400]|uniref:hypothetical protein n=1 Tax=Streptomyces sp. NPDC056400 TaxID=3345808 RepID=UPI0035DACE19